MRIPTFTLLALSIAQLAVSHPTEKVPPSQENSGYAPTSSSASYSSEGASSSSTSQASSSYASSSSSSMDHKPLDQDAPSKTPVVVDDSHAHEKAHDNEKSCLPTKDDEDDELRVIGYFPFYHADRQPVASLNFSLYTDVIFFAAVPELNQTFSFGDMPVEQAERLAKDFTTQANKFNVTPMAGFGGWEGSRYLSNLTSSDRKREAFAQTLVNWCKAHGFGGLELSWTYPGASGIGCNANNPRDAINLGKTLKEVRKLWPEAVISAAISVNGLMGTTSGPASVNETHYLVKAADFVNLMAYDFWGPWSETTGPASALDNRCSGPNSVSVKTGIAALKAQGFTNDKIVLSIPTYARASTLLSPTLVNRHSNGADSFYYQQKSNITMQGGKSDDATGVDPCGAPRTPGGTFLVTELISNGWLSADQKKGLGGFTRHWDKCSGLPFLTDGKTFITYDDYDSTALKARFAAKHDMAGISFFDTLGAPDATIYNARMSLDV